MTTRLIGFGVSLLLLLSACGDAGYEADYHEEAVPEAAADQAFEDVPRAVELPPAPGEAGAVERKLIKTGTLAIEVADVNAAARRAKAITDSLGGYVAQETSNDYGRAHRELTLKLPAARFDATVPRLEALAAEVRSRDIRVVDRTTEYVDVAARLQTQRALAARLRQLVTEANAVRDVIEVERELARVTAEVEAFEARLKSIDRDAAYATLTLSITGPSEPALASSFLQDLGESLSFGVGFLRAAVLGVVALWPLWLVLVPLVLWWRRSRRRRAIGPLQA